MFNCAFRQLRGRGSWVEGCGGRGGNIDICNCITFGWEIELCKVPISMPYIAARGQSLIGVNHSGKNGIV